MRIDRWKVKQQMNRAGIATFGELAERVEVTPQTVSAWFRGMGFSSETLAALCRVLGCTPNDILTIDPVPAEDPNGEALVAEFRVPA
jgi:DNA-binding Xre family transcriptional regulator